MVKDLLKDPEFKNARSRKVSWLLIAEAFSRGSGIAVAAAGEAGRTRFQSEASRFTGYSVGILRGYAATAEWPAKLPPNDRLDNEAALRSFTVLDLIRRVYAVDRESASDLISTLKNGRLSVSSVRAELKHLALVRPIDGPPVNGSDRIAEARWDSYHLPETTRPVASVRSAPKPTIARLRTWRTEDALVGIEKLLERLCRYHYAFLRPEGVSAIGVRCSAIAWLNEEMTEGVGFEVINAADGLSRATLSDHVSRGIVAADISRNFTWCSLKIAHPDLYWRLPRL